MNIGKLYQIKKYFWYLYPTNGAATAAAREVADGVDPRHVGVARVAATAPNTVTAAPDDADDDDAAYWTDYWSNQLNCDVSYLSPSDIFCLLEKDGTFLKVLTTNGEIGWIIYPKNETWTKGCIEEVTL
jgi:hypothetical protein